MKSKTFLNICGGILFVVIAIAGGYFGWVYGVPYLVAKSNFDQNYPTIERLQSELTEKDIVIDSLQNKVNVLEHTVRFQEQIISERDLQSTISSQLNKLQQSYDRNEAQKK